MDTPFALGQPLLRRSVIDPVTGNVAMMPSPTGEVVSRSNLLPFGVTDEGRMTLAAPQALLGAYDAFQYPGQVARGEKGVFDPATGHVSQEAMDAANGIAGLAMTGGLGGASVRAGETALGAGPIRAYHGSPHDFDKFSMSAIGTGEGAQAYGHGLYFAGNEGVARSYRDALRADPALPDSFAQRALEVGGGDRALAIKDLKTKLYYADDPEDIARYTAAHDLLASGRDPYIPQGHMYEVGIHADPAKMLDWDKPLAAQGDVGERVSSLLNTRGVKVPKLSETDQIMADLMGMDWQNGGAGAYKGLANSSSPAAAAQALRDAGIPGLRYLDGGSRGVGEGTHNYVTFSDDIVSILRKYGLAGMLGGGAAAASMMQPGEAQAAPAPLGAYR